VNINRVFPVVLVAISLILSSLPISARSVVPAPPSTVHTNTEEKFVFSKVDQELLEEIKLLDERFEKEGVVYHHPGLDAYLNRVGMAIVADKKLENVEWKFRALRDPIPNAFALPNGSIYINTGLLALLDWACFTKS
jgi:predicted Zn-dependent protease